MTRAMPRLASFLALAATAFLGLGQTVKYTALETLEQSFDAKLRNNPGKFPFEILSNPSVFYIPGAGVTMTCRLNLVYATLESPFRPAPPTREEFETLRQNKLQKVPVLEKNMQDYLADAAGSPELDEVRPTELIAIGVTMFYFPKEDSTGLPKRIVMSAEKEKLLQARRNKVDVATVIQETKL
jgi:hypothetical protein